MTTPQHPTRRTVVSGAAAAGIATTAAAATGCPGRRPARRQHHPEGQLTVLGTTDLHGNVFNWDYFKNAEYDDAAHNDIGLAKVSTL